MKLYAVTKGCYSDYHIITLTTSMARAKHLAKMYSDKFETARVETYEEGDPNDNRIPYMVYFYRNGSTAVFAKEPDVVDMNELMQVIFNDSPVSYVRYEVLVLAISQEQALKIAADKLAQYKAEKEGI